MRFLTLAPAAALALLAGVAAAVMLLYWLKPTPRRLTVSSTLIWRRVLRERKRNPDRLRWWISLLLALLIALSVALAVTSPELASLSGDARRIVLVVDNSTTLASLTSDGKTRWDHAVQRAREVLRSGGAGSRYLVADTQRLIASPHFEEREAALGTLGRLRVVAGGDPAFPGVVRAGETDVRAVFVTDGVAPVLPPASAETISVFQAADNAGISAFEVRALPGDPRRFHAFVEVLNASPGAKHVELHIAGAGGKPLMRLLDIAGGAAVSETLDVSGFEAGPLRASLSMPYDALTVDDVAYSFLPPHKSIRVGLVTSGNPFLERSLRLLPGTQLNVMAPERFHAQSGVDAWVFDRYAPKQRPDAPALLFRPSRADWLPPYGGDLGETAVSSWTRGHPVTDGLSLRDVLADHALAIRPGSGLTILATDARGRPLILASASGPRWVEAAFSLGDSNLPLQAGFPVFLSNVLSWMTSESLAQQSGLGLVQVPVTGAKVFDVQGQKVAARDVPGATLIEAEQPGLYTAVAPDRRVHVAANLADPAVTAINASRLAAQPAAPVLQAGALTWARAASPWFALLLIAMLLLVLEWWSYNRRLTV